jgi:hypothetical protein
MLVTVYRGRLHGNPALNILTENTDSYLRWSGTIALIEMNSGQISSLRVIILTLFEIRSDIRIRNSFSVSPSFIR